MQILNEENQDIEFLWQNYEEESADGEPVEDAAEDDEPEYEEVSLPEDENDFEHISITDDIHDEEEYYSDYGEETDEELQRDLPDATDVLEDGDEETDMEIPEENINDEGLCSPKRHFVFHKKHKCGSTAFRFIFQAYAHKHSLVGAKTMIGPFLGGYPGRFDPRFVGKRYNYYDYSSSHVRFDGPAFRSVFPSDTIYLTVIREPLSHFESTFNFFYTRHHTLASASSRQNDLCCWGMPFANVSGWNSNAVDYLRQAPDNWNKDIPWAGRGRNFQAFELGWDVDNSDDEYIQDQLKMMENDFHLVMISNYFFESLVLLKRNLCMDWTDLYVPPTKVKHYERAEFTDSDQTIFNQFYKQDVAIFNHFNKTFWQEVENYGHEKMKDDVQYLKSIYAKCDIDKSQKGCGSGGHQGHEAIKSGDDRKRIVAASMPHLLQYMKSNGGDCPWGKFPVLWNKYFPAT